MKSCRLSIERGRLFMWRYTLFNYTGTSLSIKPSYTYMIDQREKKKNPCYMGRCLGVEILCKVYSECRHCYRHGHECLLVWVIMCFNFQL